jgi:hypothetical protein
MPFFSVHSADDTRSAAQGILNSVFLVLYSSAGHKSKNYSFSLEANPYYIFHTMLPDIPLGGPLFAQSEHQ